MSFGKRLLEARKKKGISKKELAEKMGTKSPVIGRYERDEMTPSIKSGKENCKDSRNYGWLFAG